MKRLVQNLLLTLASVALFLGVAEAALWLVAPPPRINPYSTPLYVRTPWGVGLKANAVGYTDNRIEYRDKPFHIDEEGRRVTPAAALVRDPTRVIHVFGDSQTFGQGLSDDEAWPNLLQRGLIAAGYRDVQVENLGIPGINVDQYYMRLKAILPRLRAGDLVLVGLSWNDLMTPQNPSLVAQAVGGYLVTAPAGAAKAGGAGPPAPPPGTTWRLRLYRATGIAVPHFRDVGQFALDISRNSALLSLVASHLRTLYYRWRSDNNAYRPLAESGVPESNFKLLAGMQRRARAAGAGFAVIFLPERFYFDDDLYRVYSQGGRAFPAQDYMAYLARPLCARYAIRCVNTFDALHRHYRDIMAYPVDGHYAPAGAARIGEVAVQAVLELLGP